MKNTIIIHGLPDKEEYHSREYPSPSNSHFIPWLQKELNVKDEISFAPEMPIPYDPVYSDHKFTDREHFCTKEFPELLDIL